MKRFIPLVLAAVTMLGIGAAQAQPYPGPPPGGPGYGPPPGPGFRPHGPPPPWGGPPRPGWRHWNRGDRFYGSRYVINNWRGYALPPPWPGYYWARSGGEFIMLNGGGIVGNVVISPNYP